MYSGWGCWATRVSWWIHHGYDPGESIICHKCDNPPCTRPEHLFLGTHAANMADMLAKGRGAEQKGSKSHRAKIKEEDVIAMREAYWAGRLNQRQIALGWCLSKGSVSDIVNGNTWRHVPMPTCYYEAS